jgi:hypothetical protein
VAQGRDVKKEYGKLTSEQFQAVISKLPELRQGREEMGSLLAKLSKRDFDSLMVRDFSWGALYELSFAEHMAYAMLAFGLLPWFGQMTSADDPQQALIDSWDKEIHDDDVAPGLEPQHVVGLAYSLQRTVLSVMLFQRSLSGLVQEVREQDNMDALFNAVRVDRTVTSCPTIADKIARAQMRDDRYFFQRLRNALKGPTHKHWAAYCDLRYSLYVLRDLGFKSLSDAQLEKLLVHTLKVYPDTPSARKNLRAQYQQSKRITTT